MRTPPIPPTSYAVQTEISSPMWAGAFATGCHGAATGEPDLRPGPVAMFGSPARWYQLQQAIAEGREWYYGDHAYFGRGRRIYRITRNDYQSDGAVGMRDARPDRYQSFHLDTAPAWRASGSSIIVCPNSPIYMAQFGIDAKAWTLDIVSRLLTVTNRPLVVRWKSSASRRPLYLDLHEAWCVIVYSSAAAVEAIRHGIPVISLAPFAATRSMGGTSLDQVERPPMPDGRESFLWNLAEQQWSLDEIAAGVAWRYLCEHDSRPAATDPPRVYTPLASMLPPPLPPARSLSIH